LRSPVKFAFKILVKNKIQLKVRYIWYIYKLHKTKETIS